MTAAPSGKTARRRWAAAGAALVWACWGCGNEPRAGAAIFGHATLNGLDDHSGTRITLSYGRAEATTDRFGYFALPAIAPGEYFVIASNPGTLERTVAARVVHDGVRPSSAHLALSPVGRITGTVTALAGGPVVGASVEVLGRDRRAHTVEGGAFVLDPAPAGAVALLTSASGYEPTVVHGRVGVGGSLHLGIALSASAAPDPYAGNRPPALSPIDLAAQPIDSFPAPIPLVATARGHVRRRGLYRLSVTATDPDGDEVTLYWRADRGTIGDATGPQVLWTAGSGTSTLVCTAVDTLGATATVRTQVEATGDDIRGAGRNGERVYYGERRDRDFDVYSYDLRAGTERVEAAGDAEQHAVTVVGPWLAYADAEFVFVTPLVYRLTARNLVDGTVRQLGQSFDHDDTFVLRLDLCSHASDAFVPYWSADGSEAPRGYGYYSLNAGTWVTPQPFPPDVGQPASLSSFTRRGERQVWFDDGGRLWASTTGSPPTELLTLDRAGSGDDGVLDLQISADLVAYLLATPADGLGGTEAQRPGTLWWVDPAGDLTPQLAASSVTSFVLHARRLAYVQQGPSSASVELLETTTGVSRTLSHEPHFARRVYALDDRFVIWGDQGSEGKAFVPLNTELLWIAEVQ